MDRMINHDSSIQMLFAAIAIAYVYNLRLCVSMVVCVCVSVSVHTYGCVLNQNLIMQSNVSVTET